MATTIVEHNSFASTDLLSDGTFVDHDCYADDTMDYRVEAYTYYQPTQEQINNNTDHDETAYMAICETCGEDMPHIDLSDYGIDDGSDDYDRMGDR